MRAPSESDPAISNLLRWLGQGGVTSLKFNVVTLGEGQRGVFAVADLAPGETLLRVPRSHLIGQQDARASDIGRALTAHTTILEKAPYAYLSAFVLQEQERGERSYWKPFLDTLPRAFPTHPLFFSQEELALLKGSPVLELLELDKRELSSRYATLCEQVPGFSRFSMDSFLWAHYAVASRGFGWVRNGAKEQFLVPLVDMLNEGRPFNTSWGMAEDGQHFELKALSAIPAGTELLDSYGNKCNSFLLLKYGYLHAQNPYDELQLSLTLPADIAPTEDKLRLLGFSTPDERMGFTLRIGDMTSAEDVLAFLRVVHGTGPELDLIKSAADPRARVKQPLSPANEKKVVQAFVATCHRLLAAYETTLEEDERLLKEGGLSFNARNCVLLRRGEKQILTLYAQYYAVMGLMA
jgi:rubisco large subunit methyltransferase-like protein/SET domain-containing protein